jgi:THAP domain-containing protein 1/3
MPNKCIAFDCKTGYAKQDGGSDDNNIKPTLHSFPKDKVVFDKWIKALSRKDFIPSRNSRVCSKHFLPSDFVEVSQDSNIYRTKKQTERKLNLRYLKDDAVPSIFDNVPSYMTGNEVSRRTTTMATASTRS